MCGRTLASSSSLHLSFRMLGFTLWRQRCAHCWPVRPGISSATVAQRLPYFAWGGTGREVSGRPTKRLLHREKVERRTDETSASVGKGGAYLEAGEDDVLGVGPWRALEVNGVGHEGCWGVASLRFTRVSAGSSKLAFSRAE